MAMDPMNESYNRCMAELRARYSTRGVSANMRNENALYAKKETEESSNSNESYILFDSRSMIGDRYRSGEYNGSKYMTSDDFIRYFKSRRSFYSMQGVIKSAQEAETEQNPALPARRGRGGEMRSSDSGKEGHLKTLLSAIKVFVDKWFPVEVKEGRTEGRRVRLPVAAMSGIAVFSLSLGLIVGGSVMIGSASGELGKVENEIELLEVRQDELKSELDLKYDISEIESDAKELGMIKREYADNKYIKAEGKESVIVYDEKEDKSVGLAALLSAFGIKLD